MSVYKKPSPSDDAEEIVFDDGGTGLYDACVARFADSGWVISCDAHHSVWAVKADGSYSVGIAYGEVQQRGVADVLEKIAGKMNSTAPQDRVAVMKAEWGARRVAIIAAIDTLPNTFACSDVEHACPGVPHATIMRVLRELADAGEIESGRRGRGAIWERVTPARSRAEAAPTPRQTPKTKVRTR